ncbi:MAG: Dam family site-specific DNA-(adenine-N6)-methyltransferase [Clostridiales Family XIII bacterium]|nr:Dam family site-specific DNA-(adenine-N6)-methyltransferase [Clostridiales Family XIII bacterium]
MVPGLLKWVGNKQRFASAIVSNMPYAFQDYYEPFLGSGAVLAELLNRRYSEMFPSFSNVYASDVLPFLIDIFNITKKEPDRLILYYSEQVEEYNKDPDEKYSSIRNRFNTNPNPWDFCLLSRTCYSGVIRFRKADGYMSTPRGPHKPLQTSTFSRRVKEWSTLIQNVDFSVLDYSLAMDRPKAGDVVYCDPPYTHSQSILYGSQQFDIGELWRKIYECKRRGVYVLLSINGFRESRKKDISAQIPRGLFERELTINCGTSMIDRLQNNGSKMDGEQVHDKLLMTW